HVEEAGARLRPGRFVRVAVRVLLQPGLELRIVQDRVDRVGDLVRRLEVDEEPSFVGEHFLRVQVRRGDDSLPRAERVGDRSARDLVRVEVRRDVHVGGEQVVDDVLLFEVLVHEDHVVGQAQLLDEGGQTHPELLKQRGEEYRNRLTALVEELGLTDNVVFVNQYLDEGGQ